MRRHSTKQPMGPAAAPRRPAPAAARHRKSSMAGPRVGVIVAINVEREFACDAWPKQLRESGILYDLLCPSLAADMAIETNHAIRLLHHHMQIETDEQYPAAEFVAVFGDQVIKRCFARDIHTSQRLVENEKLRAACDRTCKQNARKFSA